MQASELTNEWLCNGGACMVMVMTYAAAPLCSLQGASETLTFGRAHVLLPQPDTLDVGMDMDVDMDNNESTMAALCQVASPCCAGTRVLAGAAWPC